MDNTQLQRLLDHITDSLTKFSTELSIVAQNKLADDIKSKLVIHDKDQDMDKLIGIIGDTGASASHWQVFNENCPDVQEWMSTFESIANYKGIDYSKRLAAFRMLLRQGATHWLESIDPELAVKVCTDQEKWEYVKEKFLSRYFRQNKWLLEHLINGICQRPGQSVMDYYATLQSRVVRLNKSPNEILNLFIKGLRSDIKMFCLARQPKDLNEALNHATSAESLIEISQVENKDVHMRTPGEIMPQNDISKKIITPVQDLLREIQKLGGEVKGYSAVRGDRIKLNEAQVSCGYCKRIGHRMADCRTRVINQRQARMGRPRWQQPQTQGTYAPRYSPYPGPGQGQFIGPQMQNQPRMRTPYRSPLNA